MSLSSFYLQVGLIHNGEEDHEVLRSENTKVWLLSTLPVLLSLKAELQTTSISQIPLDCWERDEKTQEKYLWRPFELTLSFFRLALDRFLWALPRQKFPYDIFFAFFGV